jgi:ribosome biogenesis GTPase A
MKKGKAAQTGGQPGVTRSIGTSVKVVDYVYLLDSPGVFMPYVPDQEAMLRLALCGCVKDSIISSYILADYLLFRLNQFKPTAYEQYHEPTNDVMALLEAVARKTGRLQKGGTPDVEAAASWLIQRWRSGDLGKFVLDEVTKDSLRYLKENDGEKLMSLNQARKEGKRLLKQKRSVASEGSLHRS